MSDIEQAPVAALTADRARNEVLARILQDKLIVIARQIPAGQFHLVAPALQAGGITLIETTFDQTRPDCVAENARCIDAIIKAAGDTVYVGAGTVLSVEQVRAASDAGARYIISPNTDPEVIAETRRLGMVAIPGAMTPSEIVQAWRAGADMVKLFPADDLGEHYIRNIRAPLAHIPLMAAGGVNPGSIAAFMAAGIQAFGTNISILRADLVQTGNYAEITRLARQHVDAIRAGRAKEA